MQLFQVSSVHFLDATSQEEAAMPLRVLLMFSFDSSQSANVHGMRTIGSGELTSTQLADLLKVKTLKTYSFKIYIVQCRYP